MIHPYTEVVRVSDAVGEGVVATRLIPRGTIVWTQDVLDRVFHPSEVSAFPVSVRGVVERLAHIDEQGRYVLCWDAGRLINHSCEPSLRGIGTWFQVARRDLQPGEPITCDYAECNIEHDLECLCGHAACRGRINGRDLLSYAAAWDIEVQELVSAASAVEQALWPYLLDSGEAESLIYGGRSVPSFVQLFARPVHLTPPSGAIG